MDKKQLINNLRKNGFSNKILNAFSNVRREDFVSEEFRESAYEDIPLPIGQAQTTSQPYTIAFMLNLLELSDNMKIIEIGSGSGYVLALVNEISKTSSIYGVERIKEIAERSKLILKHHKNIKIIYGDGSKGLKGERFDRILVSASADKIPIHLYPQLNENGILVCVVKNSIYKIKKINGKITEEEYPGFVFVPLVSE